MGEAMRVVRKSRRIKVTGSLNTKIPNRTMPIAQIRGILHRRCRLNLTYESELVSIFGFFRGKGFRQSWNAEGNPPHLKLIKARQSLGIRDFHPFWVRGDEAESPAVKSG